MTKSIRSYPKNERASVAQRRVKNAVGGLGTLSAAAYLKRVSAGTAYKDEVKVSAPVVETEEIEVIAE